MPDGRKVSGSRRDSGESSPRSSKSEPSPTPVILPPPIFRQDRRASTSIFSLLNEARPRSPQHVAPLRYAQSQPLRSAPTSPPYPRHYPPHSAPLRPSSQECQIRRPSVMAAPRPDLFRRHSAHPYDSPAYANAAEDFGGTSRAPISRTTKACNACRTRKVRCDAGGLPNGEPADCSRCREAGVECVYSGPQKKRGPCPG